jgi:hypothetical protein
MGRTAMKLTLKVKKNGMSKSDSSRRRICSSSEKGVALVAVVVFTLILTILGFSVLIVASNEIASTRKDVNRIKAFYLAEAGVEVFSSNLTRGVYVNIGDTELGEGSYRVDFNTATDPPTAIATGIAGGQEKRIQVTASFLAPPFEYGVYAGGFGGMNWSLVLNGTGNPTYTYQLQFIGGKWVNVPISDVGGKDTINGNIFVDGDVDMFGESRVNPPLPPNPFELDGDVDATGDITRHDSSTISGDANSHAPPLDHPDLIGMKYAVNNTHNVSQIFEDAGVTHGYLPTGSELRDVFVKNPTDRSTECASTVGDDFFFEPSSGFVIGGPYSGDTPLHAGNNRVFYVDGDVWVHSKPTYGFKMDGKVTIVATGNIHVCDNLQYADANTDMLGLVALGKYDEDGDLVSGGNVYFGDPGYGNMSVFSGMIFAANNFYYNTDPVGSRLLEPDSGFTITGNLTALNQISIDRDWYTKYEYQYVYDNKTRKWTYKWVETEVRPASYCYDSEAGQWKWIDAVTGVELTDIEINGESSTNRKAMRHYQMVINYDDRVRSRDTQPPGLPKGVGLIFEGLSNWEELP